MSDGHVVFRAPFIFPMPRRFPVAVMCLRYMNQISARNARGATPGAILSFSAATTANHSRIISAKLTTNENVTLRTRSAIANHSH